ncbi:purine-nucleoside phosphorylase [Rheinheimera muenzenbergensis]|uniref:Purine nucleoside phosphorylase DeoD-type n=1 Tax=Rheinheimera muenzenbergensis TaxID=1193628 RepID=A0ABU8C8P5_9GAMM|nr:purine-nucleoside phosphorylase [Gammaproteobacteria bacterium]MBU1555859.1 purine-nucleoside phosphorylase [Gammaproteobacteria bacterium]MBU2071451.1 purine-nucleoside phosphorylase [Gammaproteobacteria bacterium]MBU2182463.1 purine-nucleoside phosphorylase [Gammaproteobacteria bacterium]MBU2205845.1 purine-nucleoside phosphorylase [Gammaproteobacteria bacterium]
MATPHINAPEGAFAQTVLMPGDPLRAKHIAETFLTDAVCVNTVRNMFGYTGTYKGKPVSVLGSGMGIPSMSIYATELVKFYGVKNIIRIGSCGGLPLDVKVRDVVIGMGASTDSNVNRNRLAGMDFAAIASFDLLEKAVAAARAKNINVKVGNVFTSDLFYNPSETLFDTLEKYGVLAVEMEAAGLYGVAAEYGINALAIFTVSDHIRTGEALSAELRQTSFNEMVEVALGCL